MELSEDDAFGMTEEKKKQWCLLAVSVEGHPTYMCMGCHKKRLTVETRGASLPEKCDCGQELVAPPVHDRLARALMAAAGHENLLHVSKHHGDEELSA